jgi:adenylosuccinate synthase
MAVEKLLLLSGAIGAGKSSVATALMGSHGFRKIGSSDYLKSQIPINQLKEGDELRLQLQELGDRLDQETDYLWIVNPVAIQAIANAAGVTHWLIDAVRKKRQVEHFRHHFGANIRHVHIGAPEEVLRSRYGNKGNYDQAIAHPNEVNARSLSEIADRTFDSSVLGSDAIASRILMDWEG